MTIFRKLSLCIVVYNVIHYNIKAKNTRLVPLNKSICHVAQGSERKMNNTQIGILLNKSK